LRQGWREEREDEGRQREKRGASLNSRVRLQQLEMVAQQHYDHARYAERVGRRSILCGWQFRERLRRIDCNHQRPLLVRWIKEALLKRKPEQFTAAGSLIGPGRFAFRSRVCHVERSRDISNIVINRRLVSVYRSSLPGTSKTRFARESQQKKRTSCHHFCW